LEIGKDTRSKKKERDPIQNKKRERERPDQKRILDSKTNIAAPI
jgi:hypothetical protein